MTHSPKIKIVNPDNPLTEAELADIAALAKRQRQAGGLLLKAINAVGGSVEDGLKVLPKGLRDQIDDLARTALRQSYDLAQNSRKGLGARVVGDRLHGIMAAMSGALGGAGGIPTALAELPVATTLIFRAVQGVAEIYGEDITSPETRIECLRVFGAGGPQDGDDGVDTAFIGARLTVTGASVNALISKVAPRFAVVLGQKLASQAVPVLGAAAGAGTNYAFTNYYIEMAHVHFGLRRLCRTADPDLVADAFHSALADKRIGH
jgi:uncharacterized protein (DUF697 family)